MKFLKSGIYLSCGAATARQKRGITAVTALLLLLLLFAVVLKRYKKAPDLSEVPGSVISHQPAPLHIGRAALRPRYVGSPSLAILPSGEYVASHDLFGYGSSQNTSGVTKIFHSSDRGTSWTQVSTLNGQFWSTVFVHENALYIFGYSRKGGDIILRRSNDGGYHWTTPVDEEHGLLKKGKFGGTPNRPVVHNGRLWIAQSTRVMSAPVEADLLKASSWTSSNTVKQEQSWLDGRFPFWSEAQVTASSGMGVVLLPKVNQLPYTALLRAKTPKILEFDYVSDFVEIPGAEKKFGAAYDPVSKRYYVCSNPVLPAHHDDWWLGHKPAMIRNTAALLSSRDLYHWDMVKLFLYSPDLYHEAFQYLNFAFDGEDLAVVSRTAFKVGGPTPPRGHDSNLMTFHRIPDFRHASPAHELAIDTDKGQVLRYERTRYERAPLGLFPLGSRFEGKPLKEASGLAQDKTGHIYVREKNGRVLRFDPAGNFLGTTKNPPPVFMDCLYHVKQPPAWERSWTGAVSNTWEEPANWYYWGRPDTSEEIAVFGSGTSAQTPIVLNRLFHVKSMRFLSSAGCTLAGDGAFIIEAPETEGAIEALQGTHVIKTVAYFSGPARIQVEPDTGITFENDLNLDGNTLTVMNQGLLHINGAFSMSNGRIVVHPVHPVVFGGTASPLFDGVLEVRRLEPPSPRLNDQLHLFDFTVPPDRNFEDVVLPPLPPGLAWNTTDLYTHGTVAVAQAP